MSNVFCVAWRTPCLGLRSPSLHPPNLAPCRSLGRQISPIWCLDSTPRRLLSSVRPLTVIFSRVATPKAKCSPSLNRALSRTFQSSAPLSSSKPSPPPIEKGVQLRNEPFSKAEIEQVFGTRTKLSPAMGNRVLSVLQARRLAGTLDLDLPADIKRVSHPAILDKGLEYLRKNYPLDEDAAIMARIEREERETEEKFIRQAEDLGLYKPQSGSYGAELGEKNDPSGKSVLAEIRKRNEERLLAEAENKRQEWLEGEEHDREKLKQHLAKNTALQKFEDTSALEVRGRADPSQRPLLAWIQKHHLRATDTDADFSALTTSTRLLPALIFTLLTLGLCYGFAVTYEAPARTDRMWPNLPPAAATVGAIIGINVGVFALWRAWPPAWRLLNRYFISVPAYPRVFSLVGNVFSHQTITHLGINMFVLWIFGTRLHDDIGRGNFLALYLASGVLGSFASLTTHVLKNSLFITSLGASGAIAGMVAASGLIHSDEKWTIAFLPRDWQQQLSAPAWMFLAGLVTFDIAGAVMNRRMPKLDYYAHLGGYLTGAIFALNWRENMRKERERNRAWLDKVISR
ncbi:hypothetical protein ASPVEDRAFT_37096 [Aspergillus versicolor CBS 583.65]|uniref:Peptidase S54 rhomboid domain-containing protein n=1 Tax=Aspergillus versicolor CBS 583.65 TaxID=1036611 RepID=A0A1L9P877_ASPVE|nr:uncharacterized protein ASPVEDRAFT_37096 [Aspergillus versicolor CBS 583.65]OJI97673.1 hypothetical protein ASPVEDRAFT_37096 [Aspergillus versicolor CBS 583.65]